MPSEEKKSVFFSPFLFLQWFSLSTPSNPSVQIHLKLGEICFSLSLSQDRERQEKNWEERYYRKKGMREWSKAFYLPCLSPLVSLHLLQLRSVSLFSPFLRREDERERNCSVYLYVCENFPLFFQSRLIIHKMGSSSSFFSSFPLLFIFNLVLSHSAQLTSPVLVWWWRCSFPVPSFCCSCHTSCALTLLSLFPPILQHTTQQTFSFLQLELCASIQLLD